MSTLTTPKLIISGVGHVTPPAGTTLADMERRAADELLARLERELADDRLAVAAVEARTSEQDRRLFARLFGSRLGPIMLRHALGMSTTLRNARLDAVTTAIGTSGLLRIYDGTKPAVGGTVTTLLAQLALSSTAAGSAASGVLTFSSITADSSADATGTATWFRIATSGGTHVIDGTVGTSGADINFNSVAFTAGANISVSSLTITEANA